MNTSTALAEIPGFQIRPGMLLVSRDFGSRHRVITFSGEGDKRTMAVISSDETVRWLRIVPGCSAHWHVVGPADPIPMGLAPDLADEATVALLLLDLVRHPSDRNEKWMISPAYCEVEAIGEVVCAELVKCLAGRS